MIDMRKLILAIILTGCSITITAAQGNDKQTRMLADNVATAFSNGLTKLDRRRLLRGALKLSIQYWITDVGQPEFESKTFANFSAMEGWLKSEENEPGFPVRTSGERVSCRSGICRLDIVDNQMAHTHVYLTRIWYGYSGGHIYGKRIRILYG